MDQSASRYYREYIGEVPLNTVKAWGSALQKNLPWDFVGWTGEVKEPYRHWAAYPDMDGVVAQIWDALNFSFKADGFNLKPERVIANLFNHGDSSWLHRDCDSNTAWTAILYLNEFWDLNWAGHTVLVENNEVIKAFAPTPGKFILFKSNMLHGATPVSREAPYPRLGLTFQCETDDSNLQRLSKIEVPDLPAAKL